MVIINQSPTNSIYAAYNEGIIWNITIVRPSPILTTMPALELYWYWDGALVGKDFLTAPIKVTDLGTDTVYVYNVDGQSVAQPYFDNQQPIYPLTQTYHNDTKHELILGLKAKEWLPDNTGVLIEQPELVEALSAKVANAVINRNFDKTFVFGLQVLENGNLLSNKPSVMRVVCEDESETIAFWHPEGNGAINKEYRYKDAAGNILSSGFIPVAKSFESSIHVIGIAPINLEALTPSIPTPANWAKLEIALIESLPPITVYREQNCCRKFRIWFLNKYGVYDQLTVKDEIDIYSVTSKNFAHHQNTFGYDRKDFYNNRINAKGKTTREAYVMQYPIEAAEWLRELLISPSVYIQYDLTFSDPSITTNQYISVVVKDGEIKVFDSINEDRVQLSFKIEYSNIDISQTN